MVQGILIEIRDLKDFMALLILNIVFIGIYIK